MLFARRNGLISYSTVSFFPADKPEVLTDPVKVQYCTVTIDLWTKSKKLPISDWSSCTFVLHPTPTTPLPGSKAQSAS